MADGLPVSVGGRTQSSCPPDSQSTAGAFHDGTLQTRTSSPVLGLGPLWQSVRGSL